LDRSTTAESVRLTAKPFYKLANWAYSTANRRSCSFTTAQRYCPSNPAYIDATLAKLGMTEARPAVTPLEADFKLDPTDTAMFDEIARYQRLIGSLM
jgi:hypothetical protein